MQTDTLKYILIAIMLITCMFFGLIPIKIIKSLLQHDGIACSGHKHRTSKIPALIISLLTCFSGGIFLAILFLDLYPDANKALSIVKSHGSWSTNYPIVEVIILIGYISIHLLEYVSHKIGHVHSHHDQTILTRNPQIMDIPNYQSTAPRRQTQSECEIHAEGHSITNVPFSNDERKKIIKTLSFIFALMLHSSLEGMAFGVQPNPTSIISLFFGLIVHKAVVAFSVGVRLMRCHHDKPLLVVFLVTIFAMMTPIFGVIGILIQDSAVDELVKNQLSTILIGFAIGTFLYITFHELLAPEHENEENKFAKIVSCFVGILIISIVMIFSCAKARDPLKLPRAPIEKWFTRRMFNDLFPKANLGQGPHECFPYSYNAFIISARYFPKFGSGITNVRALKKEEVQRRDVAAYFAHIIQETGENRYDYLNETSLTEEQALKCFYQGGLYHWFEGGVGPNITSSNKMYTVNDGEACHSKGRYCSETAEAKFWSRCNGQNVTIAGEQLYKGCYFGRGPLQLSWNYNYGRFQYWLYTQNIKVDLLKEPNLVMTKMDPPLAMLASLYFYMTPSPPKPSMHSIITGSWVTTNENKKAGYKDSVFGPTSLVINNECTGEQKEEILGSAGENRRIKAYKWFCEYFKVRPGNERALSCRTMPQGFDLLSHNHSWQPNWSTTWKSSPCDCIPTQYSGALAYFDPKIYGYDYEELNENNRLRCVFSIYKNPKRFNMDESNSPCLKHKVKLRLSKYGIDSS
uniref:Glyco_hydro_19_cat domain-containing protein n=1 Tax=Rhabditophanes sp. KR3021 TaxID=114890 RepID=A0AC35TVQ4_9BILA